MAVIKGYPTKGKLDSDGSDDVTITSLGGGKIALDTSTVSAPCALQFDDAGSGVSYVGMAAVGTLTSAALWRVKKMAETGADIAITWADGDSSFDNIWDNRASLSYS